MSGIKERDVIFRLQDGERLILNYDITCAFIGEDQIDWELACRIKNNRNVRQCQINIIHYEWKNIRKE